MRVEYGNKSGGGTPDEARNVTGEGMKLCNRLREAGAKEQEAELREVVLGLIQMASKG